MARSMSPHAGAARMLLLLRHGQSTANAEDSSSGWLDVASPAKATRKPVQGAELLAGRPRPRRCPHLVLLVVYPTAVVIYAFARAGDRSSRCWASAGAWKPSS